MKPKNLFFSFLAALGLTALGLALRGLREPPAAGAHSGDSLFPQLLDSINEVASIQVTTAKGGYQIVRKDGVWGVAEKGGYPVEVGQITKALIGFAELRKIEAKTSDPARYADIGVQDVTAEGATSKLVSLRDSTDKDIASLIVGKSRSGRGTPSVYVRRVDDPQSWLVEGNLDVREDGTAWLDKKILEVKRGDVRAVETTHPDGDVVLASKQKREDTTFEVAQLPPDRELKYPTVANGMGGALEYLNLQDVLPAAGFEMPPGEPIRTRYWTFDGMRVDVAVFDKDSKTYATFHTAYDAEGPPGVAVIGPVAAPESEAESSPDEAAAEGNEAPKAEAPKTKSPEEVRAEAEKLNARIEPWIFEIPAYNKTNFAKRMSDMLKEVEAPHPEDGAATAPGADAGEEMDLDKLIEEQGNTGDDSATEHEDEEKPPTTGGDTPPSSDGPGDGGGGQRR